MEQTCLARAGMPTEPPAKDVAGEERDQQVIAPRRVRFAAGVPRHLGVEIEGFIDTRALLSGEDAAPCRLDRRPGGAAGGSIS